MNKIFALLVVCLLSSPAFADVSGENKETLEKAFSLYKGGAYSQSVRLLEKVKSSDREVQATVAYFRGLNFAKLQDFRKATDAFRDAIRLGEKAREIHYELGQVLYADQQIDDAAKEFRRSIAADYKVAASAYYVGYLAQLKDNPKTALDFYARIQQLSSDPDKVKQPALFQTAEIQYDSAREIKEADLRRAELKEVVLPAYKRARDFESGTPTAQEAEARINEIESQLVVNAKMRNGTAIPAKPYMARVSQDLEYDSNVVIRADGAITDVTNKDAPILRTNIFGRYQFNFGGIWSLLPELNSNIAFHMRRNTPEVYQNDNWSTTFALRGRHEHWLKEKAATGLLEAEYNYLARDYREEHKLPYYSSYWNFILGERAELFPIGPSTLKFNVKLYDSKDDTLSNVNPGVSFTQLWRLGHIEWIHSLSFDAVRARASANDERNYKYRTSTTFIKMFWETDFTPSFAFSLKDPMEQRPTRGWEKNINPGVNFRRDVFKHAYMELDYQYTRNLSEDILNYQYRRHQVKTSFYYSF